MRLGSNVALVVLVAVGGMAPAVGADPSPPVSVPATPAPTAERYYNEGLEQQKRQDFVRAARAFQDALRLREAFPEAWNGLGFALRQQGKYPEALRAYERALALRPNYAEALEYMGEALVRMGRLDDARVVLRRLEPLDPAEAGKLRALIERGR
jgi:tetratricopeptide (TPR) repeat protein